MCSKGGASAAGNYLNLVDVVVKRNAYGTQINSSITEVFSAVSQQSLGKAALIRAPKFMDFGEGVAVIAKDGSDNIMSLASKRCLLTSFHPELLFGQGFNWHLWFVEVASKTKQSFAELPDSKSFFSSKGGVG